MASVLPIVGKNDRLLKSASGLNLDLPIICQIDEQLHSALESIYWCKTCDIYICVPCYAALASVVGRTECHHCRGDLIFVLSINCTPIPDSLFPNLV